MRRSSLILLLLTAACATPGGQADWRAELNALKEQQRVDHEDLRKALAFEFESLRAELTTLKEEQAGLVEKIDKLKTAAPAPSPSRPSGPDPSAVYAFPVGQSPVRGPNDAWVTIVEVSDFQCPFCARVQSTLSEIQEKYGKDVRIVFKHNPLAFHNRAMPAAIAAMCAHEQGQFWPLHDLLFDNQRELGDEEIAGYAAQAGQLNLKKWQACVEDGRPQKQIEDDQQLATSLGARGTPAFFINGRFLSGAQPFAAFKNLIDEELSKAKKSGLARGDYYVKGVLAKGKSKE